MMDIVERLRIQYELGLMNIPEDHKVVSWGEAADEIERLRDLGLTMRNAQKKYFKERTQENLIASKQAEKAFDDALKEGE